jgi:hypothetical protein
MMDWAAVAGEIEVLIAEFGLNQRESRGPIRSRPVDCP